MVSTAKDNLSVCGEGEAEKPLQKMRVTGRDLVSREDHGEHGKV